MCWSVADGGRRGIRRAATATYAVELDAAPSWPDGDVIVDRAIDHAGWCDDVTGWCDDGAGWCDDGAGWCDDVPGGATTVPGGATTVPGGATTVPVVRRRCRVVRRRRRPHPGTAVVTGNAVCALETGQTTLTWTVRNTGGSPVTITGDDRGVSFTPTQLPASTSATGSEVIEGPAADEVVTETVSVNVGEGQTVQAAGTMTVPACTGPAAPDDIVFAFTNEASVAEATSGETIDYDYCGENTSDVDLEVVQVVDDRYGVLELPAGEAVVAPGETICTSDLGLPVTHVPTAAEEGTTIVNNAVATVRTVEAEPRTFQATDPAEVEILGFESPEQAARRQRPCRSPRWPTRARIR